MPTSALTPRVCLLGQHELGYPRNVVVRRLLEGLGCEVTELRSLAPGVLREAALLGAFARHAREIDVLWITEGGHRFVPVLKPLARSLRKPIVFDPFTSRYNTYVEDRRTTRAGTLAAAQLHWMDALSVRHADVCVFDTHEHREYFEARYGGIRHPFVLEIGVDEQVFRPVIEQQGERFEVVFYGTYIPLQGAETIAEAAALLRDEPALHFTLVGRGQTYDAVAERVRALALSNLSLREPVAASELPAIMARAQLVLGIFGDTHKAARVVPNKVVQAAACARPLITRHSTAVERYFEHGQSAWLVPAADPAALAAAIRQLRADAGLRASLAQGARAVFERHFAERALERKLQHVLDTALHCYAR